MKVKEILYAMLMVAGIVSCTAESDENVNLSETTYSLEKAFNARSVNDAEGRKNNLDLSELPPVSIDEAKTILNTLRDQKNTSSSTSYEATDGEPGQKFLTVNADYQVGKEHKFSIQMSMITYEDDGSLYYKGSKGFVSSPLYQWQLTGFGLSSDGPEGMYKFECTSYLYFKIVDQETMYIQVPVKVKGNYNPSTHYLDFTYSI